MMKTAPTIAGIARDPLWFPHRYDPGHDAVHFRQLARGAHFASHTLWSAWLCWTGALLMLGRQPVAQRAVPTPGLQATP